ncbi:predicted protein [Chaetomium globosum CBS 148.51]|uniref:Uncharacterized protein n=1 Tax=Chaetomium globosum (strain ATCC 6205 / CBS 148.51 / DSM 1962 / NBRC 6347 / NRRL 1970) TaxID=306901 RepID=Q2HGW7_CHAGB|nr:uncharacterized protein CHGG_00537 [Chaetomium globosum CBS 148.51]EAQ92302.1 predicted protein [Chaetomium globosum CBS 148.51]
MVDGRRHAATVKDSRQPEYVLTGALHFGTEPHQRTRCSGNQQPTPAEQLEA